MKKEARLAPPAPTSPPTVTQIEKRIHAAAEAEATQLWDTTHILTMGAAVELMKALPCGQNSENKLISGGDYATGATIYDGASANKQRTYHGGSSLLRSIEFKPSYLVLEVRRAWIKRKTEELTASKIEMLLKSTGI
jgi:hypothetical protein